MDITTKYFIIPADPGKSRLIIHVFAHGKKVHDFVLMSDTNENVQAYVKSGSLPMWARSVQVEDYSLR